MTTRMKKNLMVLALALLSANVWAAAPEPDFLYKGNGNGTIQGWFTGWDGEGFADARRAIGPGDYGLVYAVDHVDNNVKWHPYKGYQVPETFSLAMYTDLSAVTNVAADKAVMVAVGGNSGNHATLYKMGDKVKLDYNGGTLETSLPAGGYHLYTVTYSPSAITLSVDSGDAVSVAGTFSQPNIGFQIGGVYGGVGSYANPTGLPVAAVLGFEKVLTAEEVAELAQAYPATTESSYSNGSYNTNDGRLFAGTINQNGFIEVKRGTLVVPAGAHYQVKAIGFGDAQGETQGFGLELDGNMTITGTSTKDGNGSGGVKSGVESNEGGFLGGEWEGVGTYNIRGTLSIPNSYMQLVYDANAQTYNIENGGLLIVKGIQANKGAGNKARSSHVINVKNGGLLKVSTALSRGTLNAAIEDGGVLELADCVNATLTQSNLGGITGDGKLRLTGTNWVELPTDTTKAANLASIAEIENNLANGLLMKDGTTYTIGSLSGTGTFRYDWGSNARTLVVKQSKNTVWSGNVYNSSGHSSSSRALNIAVTSDNGSVLSVGTVSGSTATLTAGEGGTINITGSCAEIPVVLDGGTIQSPGVSDAHGTMVKSLALKQDGSYVWSGTGNGFIGIGAGNQDSKLDLGGHTLTLTGKDANTRVYLDKVTQFPNAGTINVTKGKLFIHCASINAPEGTKLVIGSDASTEADNQTLSVTELEYNGTATSTVRDMCMVTVTKKLSGTGTIPKLTLANGVEVRGQVTVSTTATLNGTIKLMEEDATFKVPAVIEGWETKVLSGVDEKKVAYDAEEKKFSLVIDDTPRTVATVRSRDFTSLEEAIAFVAPYADGVDGGLDALLAQIELVTPLTAQVPDGYELVKDSSDVYHLKSLGQVADYIVISPRNYVADWTTYVAERAKSPVAAGVTFAVKAADEIYAAYPAKADNVNGDPRNDAESIHKYIGMMQAKGAKYFVLGGRWKDVAGGWTDGDRPTMIPGIAVYPKLSKANASVLDVISSDLYYACHYKADGQDYVWDPSGDQVYVGLHETNADEMEDVRHFQPSCVVSRMNFHAATYGGVEKTYPELIVAYTAKLQRGEDSERFGGTDRYAVWASRCKSDVDGKPDCYPAQKARAEYIPTVRSAKEVFFNYLPDTHTVDQANEARGEILGQDWELLLPVEHGTAGGLGNLDCDHVKNADKIIKFFMGNVPCMTGQVFANGCFADTALSNPNGGTLVSINNTSLGYASESGMAGRKCGVSDELVDWCLDSYIGGSTAGEAWRTAIKKYAEIILDENGFKDGVLAARDHEGYSIETAHEQEIQVPNKCYVIAAMIEEMLFGDPLVRIQTEKGGNTLAATVERAASVKSVCAADFGEVLADFGAADAVSLTIKGNPCGSAATAVSVPAGKTLAVNLNATLVAETVTVAGTLSGSGTVDGNLSFSAGATLDASKANKIRVATGKTIAADAVGINILLAADTPVPAVKTLAVLDQDGCASTGPAVKSVMAGTKPLSGPFALVGERNQFFLTRDASVPLYVDKNTSNKGAVVLSVYVTSETGVETLLEKSGEGEQHWQIPAGAKVKVTYGPDVSHSGEPNTIVVNAVYATKDITDLIPAYANGREPTTIFWNAGTGPYTGDMDGRMHMVSPYGDSVEFVATKIVDGDTIVFDPHVNKFGAVQHDVSLKDFIPVVSDAKGAELHIDVNLMMTARDADDPIFGGMRVSIQSGSTLTLKPTAANLTLGNVEFNGGSLVMTTDEASKVVKIDEIKGTTPIDIRAPLKVQSKTQGAPVAISGRVTGNGTIDAPVEIHSGARVLVSGAEYLTITGAFTTKADNEADGYHRLTVDAMATKDSLQKDSDGKYHHPILKLASKAEAEAAIPHIVLVEPEVTVDGKFVNFELKADETGLIYMTELAFIQKDGFFVDGVLNRGNEVVWSYNSAFQDGVSSIRAACPAEIRFDFTGAGSGTTITVDKSIVLTGDNELLFDVPEGRTVYVNCEISGTAGIKKIGKGTLVFGLPAGVEEGVSSNQAGWNTFLGALVVEEGLVRSTKAHGYGTRHTFSDGEFDPPQIDIHHGATLDLGNICDQEHIEIISAGTITNSVHDATNAAVGQIQKLTLKGDTTVTGHTFGMAHNSIIDLQGHVLTISMARGTCVMFDDGVRREVHDHEFELDNTTVQGGRDNLDTPDIVVLQGTLSCEGSTYDQEAETFTMGENNLLNASLKVGAEACLRLNANLTVRRIERVNGNASVSVPCDNVTSADPEPHFHTFPKVWETSAKPGALDMTEKDDKFFGHIIILYQLKGGITAPRITFGAEDIYSTSVAWAAGGIYDPDVQTIMLDKGEYIECKEQLTLYGFPFNAIFFDWDGQSGVRRLFHGWNKFAAEDRALSAIITPFAYIKTGEGKMDYKLVTCDWYPWGAYADEDRSVEIRNTNPLCDPDWAYAIPLWNPLSSQRENVIIATIKKFDGQDIYVDNKLNGTALTVTNGLLSTTCPRGDNAMDFVIGTDWLSKNYPDWEHYAPGKASVSDWLDEKGANGIERWQSYMLGLDPTKADSLPVLAVRKDTAPSFVKNGETYVNVTVAGVDCYGYQYISPIYAIEELAIGADGKPIMETSDMSAVTPWQTDKHFQVPVPTDGHVKYFRVKVSFQGNDGITN